MKSHRKALSLLMCAVFIAATATAAFAQAAGSTTGKCSFKALNFPAPATNGQAAALNDLGGIAGTFLDSKNVAHGFLLFQGRLSTFMFPGSIGTSVSDMSRNGIIIGGYTSKDGKGHAYMVHAGGFRTITLPGFPNADFTVAGVNSNGDVVGTINSDTLPVNGFLLHNGKVTILSFPGADVTQPTSINDEGVVVGGYLIQAVNSNPAFMWKDGVFSNIKPPDSIPEPFVFPSKVSNSGVVVGSYQPESGGSGFALKNGIYSKFDGPAGFDGPTVLAVNKFDNILAQATQISQQVRQDCFVQRILRSSVLDIAVQGLKAPATRYCRESSHLERLRGSEPSSAAVGGVASPAIADAFSIRVDQR